MGESLAIHPPPELPHLTGRRLFHARDTMRTPLLLLVTLLLTTLLGNSALAGPGALAHLSGGGDELGSVPDEVRQHLMHGRWDEAIARIGDLASEKPEDMDLWLYLQAVAREHKGDLEEALTTLKGLERTYPESAWVHKARFRRAEIHRRRREFQAAEALYEEGLQRLRSEERQGELADIYVGFADELSTEPDVSGPDDGAVDYVRAHALYSKVLALGAPRATRDHAMFRMAFCMEMVQAWDPARVAFERYLFEFDPTRQRPLRPGFLVGAKIWEARYRMGLAQLMVGQTAQARRTLEDLASDLGTALEEDGSSLPAERITQLTQMVGQARFDIARTYGTQGDGALMAVAAYRRFLSASPTHARATRAAFSIASLLRSNGRAEEAVAAYQAVTERPAPTDVESEVSEEHALLVMAALYEKGLVLQNLLRYDEAIATYEDYARRYPTGRNWAAAQQGMLDSRYQVGVAHRNEERFDEARQAWTTFLEEHPLDGRARTIQFDLGVLHLEEAAVLSEEDEDLDVSAHLRSAIARWETLTKKYPGTEEASHALFQTGLLRETQLEELDLAIESYRACSFGRWAGSAAQRLRQMTEPSLQVMTERTWRGNEAARVKLRLRNVEEFEVEVYALDLEAYFRKHLTHRRIEDLDLDLIAADRRIEVPVEDYRRYAPIERDFELPVEGPGVWAVAVTADDLRATTLVLRSDVEVVVKSSRREVFVFAQDMRAEAPAEGVQVLIGLPLASGAPILTELITDADGIARLELDELETCEGVRVLALREGHVASDGLSLTGLQASSGLTPRAHISTDRTAYRPGDHVSWRAVVREVLDGSYTFEPGKRFQVRVLDSQGRPLSSKRLPLSDFGTLHDGLDLPEHAPLGNYSIQLDAPGLPTFTSRFLVQQYELQKVELSFDLERTVYYRGEEVEVVASARYYYGEAVANSPLRVSLPDGRLVELRTDAKGQATFSFETRDFLSEGMLTFGGVLTQENVSARGDIYLATHGYRASLETARDVVLAGDSFQVTLKATSPAGDVVAREMNLKVLRRTSGRRGGWQDELKQEIALSTDAETGLAHASISLEQGGTYMLRAEGLDRFDNPVTAERALTVSGDEDTVKLRLLAASQRTEVGETLELELVDRAGPGLALLTFEGETILGYRLVHLKQGVNRVQLPVEHGHFPNFNVSVAMMLGNEFFTAQSAFDVTRGLEVSIVPTETVVTPGGEAEVEIVVTDQLGQPVSAELSLAVVDASLFELYPDNTPNLRTFFEQGARRVAELRTASSCTFSYQGTTVRIDEALLLEAERVIAAQTWAADSIELGVKLAELGYIAGGGGGGPSTPGPARGEYRGPGDSVPAGRPSEVQASLEATGSDDFFLGRGQKDGAVAGRFGGRSKSRRRGFANSRDESSAQESAPAFDADTAFWTPAVVSDENGRATLRFSLPERATRWRLTSRGVGTETLLGEATATLTTRSEFFVELHTAHQLTEGDRPRIAARIHNLTGRTGRVKLSLRVTSGEDTSVLPATVELGAEPVVEHLFAPLGAVPAKDLVLELEAQTEFNDSEGGELLVSTRDEIPVRAWGLEFQATRSGLLTDATSVWLELPAGREYANRKLSLFVGPDQSRMLIDEALGRLTHRTRRYSMGGTSNASVAGDLIGACAVMSSMQTSGVSQNPEYARLLERAQGLVAALAAAQGRDGGWSWLGSGRASEPEPSARVMVALSAARATGVPPAEQTMDQGSDYLAKAFRSASQQADERKAALTHALAAAGRGDFSAANRLHRSRNRLSPAALAHLTLALVEMGRDPMASEVARLLETELQLEPGSPPASPRVFCSVKGNMGWSRSRLDMTALAILALERALPASPKVAQGVAYLLAHRPWSDNRGRGLAVAAVARFQRETERLTDRARITVEVEGQAAQVLEFDRDASGRFLEFDLAQTTQRRVRVSFSIEGRARPHFSAVLSGFSKDLTKTAWEKPFIIRTERYEAVAPRYRGKPLPTGFNVVRNPDETWVNTVRHLPVGHMTRVTLTFQRNPKPGQTATDVDYLVMEVPLPAGSRVLDGSFSGGLGVFEMRDGALIAPIGPTLNWSPIQFTLVGVNPGEFRVLPPILRSAYEPEHMALGSTTALTVLERGATSPDPYRATPDELYHRGKLLYEDNQWAAAHTALGELHDAYEAILQDAYLTRLANMMLFMSIDRNEPAAIVRFFEIIKEKDPELYVSFDNVVAIGEAYRELQEFERALLIFRATVEETFGKDLKVAGTLREQGERAGAMDTLGKLYLEFPDLPVVVDSWLTLSDEFLTAAPVAHQDASLRRAERNRASLTADGILLLKRFLSIHCTDPLAPEAGLNLVSAYLGIEDHETASALAGDMASVYTTPRFADAFQYTRAVAEWYLGREDEALGLLQRIADAVYTDENGNQTRSENRDLALYILGQIHHARRDAEGAAEYYEQVKNLFADAREALDGFHEKSISLDEVTTARPGEVVQLPIHYKNLTEAELLVYEVDLMTLYLREKNLSNVTSVNLAGISPTLRTTVTLGKGQDLREQELTASLALNQPGAYLVICRGEALHTSGLVLVTDLELEVVEDPVSGRMRIQALDQGDGSYLRDVDVRVIGSASSAILSGETDPRGLYLADHIQGTATVIARHENSHYAFHRGTQVLAQAELQEQRRAQEGIQVDKQLDQGAYLQNVMDLNTRNQLQRGQRLMENFKRELKGVQVQQVK